MLYSLNLDQPMHVHGHTLDLVQTRSTDSIISNLQIHTTVLFDHSLSTMTLPYRQHPTTRKMITYRKINVFYLNHWLSDLSSSQLYPETPDGLDTLVGMYDSTLSNLLDNHAPLKTNQILVRYQEKWYNQNIALAKMSRCKGQRKWHSSKCQINLDVYKSKCHRVKQNFVKKRSFVKTKLKAVVMTRRSCLELQKT